VAAIARPFALVDVFSSTPYLGNPVAVVLDAEGLDDAAMQRIARWTNLSETTFVFPSTAGEADYHVRIYTPEAELPFAGHPTLGAARAWLDSGGVPGSRVGVVQECQAGLVQVRAEGGLLFFAAPPTIRSGDLDESYLESTSAALGISRDQIVSHQWIDNGPGWAVIQVATAAEVLALEPDLSRIPEAMVGVLGAHPAGSPYRYELRTFAPRAGVPEDPACGSMNAAVAQWLVRIGEVTSPYRVSQGGRLHRAGDITVSPDADGTIWVGGQAVTLQRGTVVA
jgi:PhzF family phenazine biosynthesis protein